MNKDAELKENLHRVLDILMNGDIKEYKEAKKEIERIFRSSDIKKFKREAVTALEFLNKFDGIKNVKNKEAFISGLSLFFLVLSDEYFNELKNFTLKVIQDPDGHVREAIRKTTDWLFISLSDRMNPFVYPKGKPLTEKQKDNQIRAKKQFKVYLAEVEELLDKYYSPESRTVKYIDGMKPSVEKSLQMLWSRLSDLSKYAIEELSPEILKKRKEIEKDLTNLLNEAESKISVEDIKEIVYDENGQDSLNEIIRLFNKIRLSQLNNILKSVNDVWNYFPHKSLGGLSPHEKRLEYLN